MSHTLKKHIQNLLDRAAKIAEAAQSANREMSAKESADFDDLMSKAQRLGDTLAAVGELDGTEDTELKSVRDRLDELEGQLNTPIFDRNHAEAPTEFKSDKLHYQTVAGKQRFSAKLDAADLGAMIQAAHSGNFTDGQKNQVISVDAQGGYLLASNFQANVIDLARARSVMAAAGAVNYVIQSNDVGTAFVRVTGQPLLSWVREMQPIPEGQFSFGAIAAAPKKLACLIKLSVETLQSTNAAALIGDQIAKAFAAEMDRALLMGTGAGAEPQGLMNLAGVGAITSVGDVNYDDFLNAMRTVRNAQYEPNGMIYSPGTAYELGILKGVENGQYLAPPADFANTPKHTTTKITDALALVGQFNMCGWVTGGPLGGMRLEFGVAGDSFKEDAVYLRAIMPMDTVILDPAAFCKLTGMS